MVSGDRFVGRDELFVSAACTLAPPASARGDTVALSRNDIALFKATLAARTLGAQTGNRHSRGAEVAYVLADSFSRLRPTSRTGD